MKTARDVVAVSRGMDVSTWFPIGPDFVYAPRDGAPPKRLSRRNELARQAKVRALAVDPTSAPPTLYTIDRPFPDPDNQQAGEKPFWPVGASAFRSQDDGRTWQSIADSLIQANPGLVPTCIAVHPLQPNHVYLGTYGGEIHVSTTRGDTWNSSQNAGAQVTQIVIDPRGAASPATTTLYAATTAGLMRSTDGGGSWLPTTLAGDVMSLAFDMPAAAAANLYAGVRKQGVYHATDAAGAWTLLNGGPSGLPAHSGSNFEGVLVDFCRRNSNYVYVVLGPISGNISLYASSTGPAAFAPVASGTAPPSDLYRFAFAVAPNSPGGAGDVLLFTGVGLYRSNSSGSAWTYDADSLHGDHSCFGFSTMEPPAGQIPAAYVGCDGGLFVSTSLADPAVAVDVRPADFSDGVKYTASGVAQNLNHGKLSLAVNSYAADPSCGTVGYTGGQDTGLAAHIGTLGWRGLDNDNGDVWAVAAKQGGDGMKVWYRTPFNTLMITDHGETRPTPVPISTGAANSGLAGTSALRVDATGHCLSGANPITALQNPVNPGPSQVATPYSMTGIAVGVYVLVGIGPTNEVVQVQAVTATTFTASFAGAHGASTWMKVIAPVLVRIDQAAVVSCPRRYWTHVSRHRGQCGGPDALVVTGEVKGDLA